MTATVTDRSARSAFTARPPWRIAFDAAAALAAGMGVGRFAYTPILPLMHAQAGLSAQDGADLATANYVGYLLGALLGILAPRVVRSRAALRGSLVALVITLAAMTFTQDTAAWAMLRLAAGVASALSFMSAVGCLHSQLSDHPGRLSGWAFGGIGAGIAASGLVILVVRAVADWRAAWWSAAALAALLAVGAWGLRPDKPPLLIPVCANPPTLIPQPSPPQLPGPRETPVARRTTPPARREQRAHGRFAALMTAYVLEGAGYIISGTFLVAAIEQECPGWIGGGAWVLVGLAAIPSSALWAGLGRRCSRFSLLAAALAAQAAGTALPALAGGALPALVSALLFGATFPGIAALALEAGARLRFPRCVALLTAGYSVGQIAGPLAAGPLLHHGYRQALLLGALILLAATLAATVLRTAFPASRAEARSARAGSRRADAAIG